MGRTRTSADAGEAPSHGSAHKQAEQLALSCCYECIHYIWKSGDSVGAFI